MSPRRELPIVAEILGPVLGRVSEEQRPLLIAIAERLAAARYRGWAQAAAEPARRSQLLACAAREERIANQVESLFPDAAAIQRDLLAKNPDLEELNRSIFAERPLEEQYAIQAQGERVGALTWRSLARHAKAPTARRIYLECAELEEESALVLEALVGRAL